MMKVLKGKATTAYLNNLHNTVAGILSTELIRQSQGIIERTEEEGGDIETDAVGVDVKLLSVAIKFLKDNDVTADVLDSNEIRSLTDNIREIANKDNELKEISVEDMLAIAERK